MKYITTLGLEIETDIISNNILANTFDSIDLGNGISFRQIIKFHNDASASTPFYNYYGLTFFRRNITPFAIRADEGGTEVVTEPIPFEIMQLAVRNILGIFSCKGEYATSQRGATHIHVGFPNHYPWIINFLKICYYLEDVFFGIAGLGNQYRGISNSSIYSRPLSSPPALHNDLVGWFEIFDIDKIIKAPPAEDIFWRLFFVGRDSAIGRYPPARYLFVNIMSILQHGTLELRILNNTLNPLYLLSVIKFFQAICELSIHLSPTYNFDYEENNLEIKISKIFKLISKHDVEIKMTEGEMNTIAELLIITPYWKPATSAQCHLRNVAIHNSFLNSELMNYRKVLTTKPHESGFVDSHGEEIINYDRIFHVATLLRST